MTHVFADDDQAHAASLIGLPFQRPALAPAMMAGKGVRAVRCVGCQRDTLPRTDDGAPLCMRCSEVLAGTARSRLSLAPWRWRRAEDA
jgi:hypothetical protein